MSRFLISAVIYVIFAGLVSASVPLQCVICVSGTSKLCVSGTRDFVCSVSTEGRSSREAALSLVEHIGHTPQLFKWLEGFYNFFWLRLVFIKYRS